MQMHASLQDQYTNLSLAIHIMYTTCTRWNVITTPAQNYYFPIIFTRKKTAHGTMHTHQHYLKH
jgi:hypothetical protein